MGDPNTGYDPWNEGRNVGRMPMKEPKTISEAAEARMRDLARESIEKMARQYAAAREIDLLNAYLQVFTKRISDSLEDTK